MNTEIGEVEIQHRPSIGAALDLLKQELVLLQEQDVLLLKELMNIHYSIRMLKRKLSHRTNSFSNLMNARTSQFTPPPVARTMAAHASLGRVMSEPTRFLIPQRSLSIPTEDEEEEEDELADSFNSSGSDPLEPLKQSLNLDPETSSLLADMPVSLRRKYLSSLTQTSNTSLATMSRTVNKPLHSVSESKFKLMSCNGSIVRNNSSSSNGTMSVAKTEQFKGAPSSYDSDSSAPGIEITAL